MNRPRRSSTRPRRGFTLLELQAAFVVLGLGVAALVPFAVAQLKLVAAMEKRLPINATYVMMSRDHGMMNLLRAGDGSQQVDLGPNAAPAPSPTATPNKITVVPGSVSVVTPNSLNTANSMDMIAIVQVSKGP